MDCIYDKRPPHITTMMPTDSNALLAAMIASYAIPIGVGVELQQFQIHEHKSNHL